VTTFDVERRSTVDGRAPPGAPAAFPVSPTPVSNDLAPAMAPPERLASPSRGPRLTYVPGLDGLRAIAVLSVLVYHADYAWLPGGFLGVEVFFVISGYLITALLLAERKREGHIDLRDFWLRRARRLLPALGLLLVVVTAVSLVFFPDEVAGLRGDVLAALTYTTNWYAIFSQQSYFEQVGRPPLLQHLWSLAVEEQFYVFWPLIFTFGMRRFGRTRFLWLIVAGIVASTLLMVLLYSPLEDPSRVYYGTDTRATALLVGSALAFLWSPWRLRRTATRGASVLIDIVGLLALFEVLRSFAGIGEADAPLYQGGFLRLSLATGVLIAVVVHPSSMLGGLALTGRWAWLSMANPVLNWVGTRSYGIYLWHWPIFMLTRPGLDVTWAPIPLFVVRFGATFLVAELSYRFFEAPIRNGVIAKWRAELRTGHPAHRRALALRGGLIGVFGICLVGFLALNLSVADAPERPAYLLADGTSSAGAALPPAVGDTVPPPVVPVTDPVDPTATTATTATTAAPTPVTNPDGSPQTTPDGTPVTATAPPPPAANGAVDVGRVTAVGDSVMLGGANALYTKFNNNAHVDAVVGRQVSTGIGVLQSWRDAGLLGDVVVVHLGNNGTFTDQQFDQMMNVLDGTTRVVVMTVKVPRSWEGPVNQVIVNGAARYSKVTLVDWKGFSEPHPDWFYDDGMHLNPAGQAAYAQYLADRITGAL